MMTADCNIDALEMTGTQSEIAVSEPAGADGNVNLTDAEIMRRVRDIRSTWSMAERHARREEAERRFEHLLETLLAEAA
jgi:hypothetical protein